MNGNIVAIDTAEAEACLEMVAIEGRLEFGFWGWLENGAKAIWTWFTAHCNFTGCIVRF